MKPSLFLFCTHIPCLLLFHMSQLSVDVVTWNNQRFIDAGWWWLRNLDRAQQGGLSPLCNVWGLSWEDVNGCQWLKKLGAEIIWKLPHSHARHMGSAAAVPWALTCGISTWLWLLTAWGWVQEEASEERMFLENQRGSCLVFSDPASQVTKHLLLYRLPRFKGRAPHPHPPISGIMSKKLRSFF